jgi:hypothetical protein
MADLLVSFKQSRPFNKLSLFCVVMNIFMLIVNGAGKQFNAKE